MFNIICAASDTAPELKKHATFVCDEADARPTLQKAIDEAFRLKVSCVLLPGTYTINSCGERSKKGAICFYNPSEAGPYYCDSDLNYHVFEGAKPHIGFYSGTKITMGLDFYNSLPDDEQFSLFYADGGDPFGRGFFIRNLLVQLPASNKPVIVFDGSAAGSVRYEDTWVVSFNPHGTNFATAAGIPVPHADSVAFRGCCGSNIYTTEMKNLVAEGFGTGFDIGGEHVYAESLSALYNLYGFKFNCYKGKISIDDPADAPSKGAGIYPIYCVNLIDEHNVNLPMFGNSTHQIIGNPNEDGTTPEDWAPSITIRAMNVQWPNSAPGYNDRTAEDFTVGRHRATEVQPGLWRGSIEFVLDHTTPTSGVVLTDYEPYFESGSGINIKLTNLHHKISH